MNRSNQRQQIVLYITYICVISLLITGAQSGDLGDGGSDGAAAAALPWSGAGSDASGTAAAAPPTLRFARDGTFKILQLTDLHLGESGELDARTLTLVAELLDAERPHLAALTGDVVSGAFWDGHSRSWAAARAAPLVDVLAQRRVPHAFVAGNHDAEADLDRRALAALFTSAPFGVTRVGPANVTGATNYFLDVLPSSSGSGSDSDSDSVDDSGSSSSDSGGGEGGAGAAAAAPAARLWFFDSMRRGCEGKSGWGGIGRDTLEWARTQAAHLPPAPGVAFAHIPPPEVLDASLSALHGGRGEPAGCGACRTGIVAALRAVGAAALFFGHDHDNDYLAWLDGSGGGSGDNSSSTAGDASAPFLLGYGRKSGYGSYGPPAGWRRGARVILLRDPTAAAAAEAGLSGMLNATWICAEGGGVEALTAVAGGGGGSSGRGKGLAPDALRGARQQRCNPGGDVREFARGAAWAAPLLLAVVAAGAGVAWRVRGRGGAEAAAAGGGGALYRPVGNGEGISLVEVAPR